MGWYPMMYPISTERTHNPKRFLQRFNPVIVRLTDTDRRLESLLDDALCLP